MSNCFGILCIKINITTIQERLLEEVACKHSIETIGSETNTDEVIHNHERLWVKTFSLFHEFQQYEDHSKVKKRCQLPWTSYPRKEDYQYKFLDVRKRDKLVRRLVSLITAVVSIPNIRARRYLILSQDKK